MKALTYKEAAKAIDSVSELDGRFDSVCTDTRKITPNCLFIALKGENFDGHDYAAKALESGAGAVVCERDCGLGERQMLVGSTRKALLDLDGHLFTEKAERFLSPEEVAAESEEEE